MPLRPLVGLAGWSNPPATKNSRNSEHSHLEHYATLFPCVEINSSFYRPHRPATYLAWRRATPRGFRFSVKMPRAITHEAGLSGATKELAVFLTTIEPLGGKLAAILMQLPPSLAFNGRTVRAFFRSLPQLGGVLFACEPRHPSWFTESANALMAQFSVSRVATDPARLAAGGIPGGSTSSAYYRWHGSPRIYYSSYPAQRLEDFRSQIEATEQKKNIWCIFDNTARGAAWQNALMFQRMTLRRVLPRC